VNRMPIAHSGAAALKKWAMLGYPAGMARSFLQSFLPRRIPSRLEFAACTAITFMLCALPSSPAVAWGPQGHRLVASLAEVRLSHQAKQEVARLLRGEPEPTLAGVSNWADDLRENDPDLGRRSARWHYVNLAEDACVYDAADHCANGDCVIEAIRRQQTLLADRKQPVAVRRQALKFLVHFVGDIHQPLHAGYARDRGGNTHQLQVDGQGSNLHRVWDSDVVTATSRNESRNLERLRALRMPRGLGENEPGRWAEASCRIVLQDGFYPPQGTLAPEYLPRWAPTADAQLRLAGERLARLLERALATPARRSKP
jgi:nuclease S1